ncbi:hypothetical protein DV515_00018068, partial [Chloebia gouldiae]
LRHPGPSIKHRIKRLRLFCVLFLRATVFWRPRQDSEGGWGGFLGELSVCARPPRLTDNCGRVGLQTSWWEARAPTVRRSESYAGSALAPRGDE